MYSASRGVAVRPCWKMVHGVSYQYSAVVGHSLVSHARGSTRDRTQHHYWCEGGPMSTLTLAYTVHTYKHRNAWPRHLQCPHASVCLGWRRQQCGRRGRAASLWCAGLCREYGTRLCTQSLEHGFPTARPIRPWWLKVQVCTLAVYDEHGVALSQTEAGY